jgi:hypothetical protein
MAGGQRIDNHSSWMGKGSNGSVFPMGAKVKNESTAEGAGSVMRYEDTTERIKYSQEMGEKQIKRRPLKEGTRY